MTSSSEALPDLIDRLRKHFDHARETHHFKAAYTVEEVIEKLASAESENARLREALAFYRDAWRTNAEGDIGGEAHLIRSWREPTEELWNDAGHKAHVALATQEQGRDE